VPNNDSAPVLFAYDGSDYAKAAIDQAGRELRPGRQALVLTVWHAFASTALTVPSIPLPDDLAGDVEEEASNLAAEGANLARQAGFDASPATVQGDPVWQSIVDSADHAGASLIVLGSHGRTGINMVLMGSVAAAAARHTDLNVLIVHLPSDSDGSGDAQQA
jgi:nucleotide-binding universal stress UspA family protein